MAKTSGKLPLSMRKQKLSRPLFRPSSGMFAASFEHGEIGPGLFRAACDVGLEALHSLGEDTMGGTLGALSNNTNGAPHFATF